MATSDPARVQLIVTGRVQGVFFRRSAAGQARMLGVKGRARNLPDGSVEIIAEGDRSNLTELVRWSHQGPPPARVDNVKVEWQQYRAEFTHFDIR